MKNRVILILLIISLTVNTWLVYLYKKTDDQVNKVLSYYSNGVITSLNGLENDLQNNYLDLSNKDDAKFIYNVLTGIEQYANYANLMVWSTHGTPQRVSGEMGELSGLLNQRYIPAAQKIAEASVNVKQSDVAELNFFVGQLKKAGLPIQQLGSRDEDSTWKEVERLLEIIVTDRALSLPDSVIARAKENLGLDDFPNIAGKHRGAIHGGGPDPGIKVPGDLETKVDVIGKSTYIVTFIESWNVKDFHDEGQNGPGLSHFYKFKVTADEVKLIEEGGDFPPQLVE